MTDETVDCYNCGRANPEWAQVCRSCGVPLRHGEARVIPTGRFPTDSSSLISIAAVIGTIFLAVLAGLFVSGLNPTEPSVGRATPTPSASPSVAAATVAPTVEPIPTATPVPTPTATPALPGTIAFGSDLNEDRQIAEPVDTFTPGVAFAYSITMPDTFGGSPIQNEIAKQGEGDAEEVIVLERQSVDVNPDATNFGYVIGTAGDFLGQYGPGLFEWRVYLDDTIIARGTFRFTEG